MKLITKEKTISAAGFKSGMAQGKVIDGGVVTMRLTDEGYTVVRKTPGGTLTETVTTLKEARAAFKAMS